MSQKIKKEILLIESAQVLNDFLSQGAKIGIVLTVKKRIVGEKRVWANIGDIAIVEGIWEEDEDGKYTGIFVYISFGNWNKYCTYFREDEFEVIGTL